ncbi:hypothetical protein [Okeania sp. KiyG1]|uniref:hypothetical protein n=1 Tax=Okeania sp. KiyG1 TaxID=2720165 RepID=UPI0019245003|nr:hypothetical protein [Okeania sp. KiyG1]
MFFFCSHRSALPGACVAPQGVAPLFPICRIISCPVAKEEGRRRKEEGRRKKLEKPDPTLLYCLLPKNNVLSVDIVLSN